MPEVLTRVDLGYVLEEAAAIYVHIGLDEPVSNASLAEWESEIKAAAKSIFAEEFRLPLENVNLEVELLPGSLWIKIKPTLLTIVLILGLYNGVHSSIDNLQADYAKVSEKTAIVASEISRGTIHSIVGLWKNSELLEEMIRRSNPLN